MLTNISNCLHKELSFDVCLKLIVPKEPAELTICQPEQGKGKADHAQMGVGGVLISLTLAVSP